MILLHPNSVVQAALPRIFNEVNEDFFDDLKSKLKLAADAGFERLSSIKGIVPIKSSAAMYMMVRVELDQFRDMADDIEFCKKLLAEQNCMTFPSTCFFAKGFLRVIVCTKPEVLQEFGDRLQEFCAAHYKE